MEAAADWELGRRRPEFAGDYAGKSRPPLVSVFSSVNEVLYKGGHLAWLVCDGLGLGYHCPGVMIQSASSHSQCPSLDRSL